MKLLRNTMLIIALMAVLVFVKGKVVAQTYVLTPTASVVDQSTLTPTVTSTSAAYLTLTPTKITSLPKTGMMKYTVIFAAVSIGVIFFALVF